MIHTMLSCFVSTCFRAKLGCLHLRTCQRIAVCAYSSLPVTNDEVTRYRSELFSAEKSRQLSLVTRVEKIEVRYRGVPDDCVLLMNKALSTPFNCAMHIQELLMTRSVVALVNGQPWDMHRPLVDDCELQFQHFKDEDPTISNDAFWRTGSFILGYIAERAFKDEHYVTLCSFPKPNVRSGSFVYDIDLPLSQWKPSRAELTCLSRIGGKLHSCDAQFERLEIDVSLAMKMFQHNRFKLAQIPQIAAQSHDGSTVVVYRLQDHVDITKGPLISSTKQLYRYSITAIHDVTSTDFGQLKRFQGIAMPTQLPVHFWSYELLCDRATQLNTWAAIPRLQPLKETQQVISS